MANQVMAMLEAQVAPERWGELSERFTQMDGQLPPQMVGSYLVQSTMDPSNWRLISVWHSQQAFDEYRGSVQTPGGVLLFRSVGAEPKLATFEIKGRQGR